MDIEKVLLIFIGAIVGFFVSVLKDYFNERTKRKNKELEIKREKLEELYLMFDNFIHYISVTNASFYQVLQNEYSYEEHKKIVEINEKKYFYDSRRLEMLISLYFNKYILDYKSVLKEIEYLALFEVKFINNKNLNNFDDFTNKNIDLIKNTEEFKEKIVEELRL